MTASDPGKTCITGRGNKIMMSLITSLTESVKLSIVRGSALSQTSSIYPRLLFP